MTLYLRLKVKALLTNAELLGWGIGFIEFWVFMWLFVFTSGVEVKSPWYEYVVNTNAAMAYSFLGLLSMASVAISLAYSILYSSQATRYITKFTRASPVIFMIEDFVASLLVMFVTVFVIIASVMAGAYVRWGLTPHVENPVGVFVDLMLGGIALYWLSYALALVIIITKRVRATTMASFLPLILAFIVYAQLWVNFGDLVYVIPLSTMPSLLVYHSTGAIPPTGAYFKWLSGAGKLQAVDLRLAAISLCAWTILFAATSFVLLRKSRGIPVEEFRV